MEKKFLITPKKVVHIASVSHGKDSVWTVEYILDHPDRYPLDAAVFVNTGKEFKAVYAVRDKLVKKLNERGIPYFEIDISAKFDYCMFEKPICKRGTKQVHKCGYGWCGGMYRWGTSLKLQALNSFYKENFPDCKIVEYVGLCADEKERVEAGYASESVTKKCYPLYDAGITQFQALLGCYDRGYAWVENGYNLYSILTRISCRCCRNKNLSELRAIYFCLPYVWEELKEIQRRLPEPMKGEGKDIFALEKRFRKEGRAMSLLDTV